jgi:hypothetical protein
VDWIDQYEVLHVGVLLERRLLEGPRRPPVIRELKHRRRLPRLDLNYKTLAKQVVQELRHLALELRSRALEDCAEGLHDVLTAYIFGVLDQLPDLCSTSPDAVVGTRDEIDDDDFALNQLMHHVRGFHPEACASHACPLLRVRDRKLTKSY